MIFRSYPRGMAERFHKAQTFVRRTSPDKKSHRFAKREGTEDGDQKSEAGAARVYSGTGEADHFFALT